MNLLWLLAFRNLKRNWRRSITTGLAITSGFVGLALLGGYIIRVQNGLRANTTYINLQGHLQVRMVDSMERYSISPKKYVIRPELDEKIMRILDKHKPSVEFYGKFLTASGLIVADNISQPFISRSAEPEVFFKAIHHPTVSAWAQGWVKNIESYTEDKFKQSDLISITTRISDILGRSFENGYFTEPDVQLMTRTFENDLNAVNARLGLIHTTGVALAEDTSIRVPLKLMQDLMATDGYQYVALFLNEPGKAHSLKEKIKKEILELQLPLEVYHFTEGEIGEFYVGTMNFLYVMSAFFALLICGMVSLSIINSLTLGILERVRELGTLKALGFSRPVIVQLFVRETLWLCMLSFGIGIILAQIIVEAVKRSNIQFSPPGVEGKLQFLLMPNLTLYAVIVFALGAVAFLTTWYISNQKLKQSAIELLSESGV